MSALLQSLAEGAGALPPHRQAALDRVRAAGLPSQRNERWKYTSLRALGARSFAAAGRAPDIDAALLEGIPGPRLVFVNGVYSPALSGHEPKFQRLGVHFRKACCWGVPPPWRRNAPASPTCVPTRPSPR